MELEFKVVDGDGLHARPVSQIVGIASKYEGNIYLIANGEKTNAKSMINVMTAGVKCGQEFVIKAEGEDGKDAVEDLKNYLIDNDIAVLNGDDLFKNSNHESCLTDRETIIDGIAASKGISISTVYKLEKPELDFEKVAIKSTEEEKKRLFNAIEKTVKDLDKIQERAMKKMGKENAEIFSAHKMILKDPEFINKIIDKIENERINAEASLKEVSDYLVSVFNAIEDEYMRERATDIKDVSVRLLACLLGKKLFDPAEIDKETILIAEDLTPSDTVSLDKRYVKGFATNLGGRTSHSAIMARSLEIPAVVALKDIMTKVKNDDKLIIDGLRGKVIINPNKSTIKEYEEKILAYRETQDKLFQLKDKESKTKDGVKVELAGNIGFPEDIEGVAKNGGEGIGLFRTEFLYMGKEKFPTEEEQFESYKSVLESLKGKPVVVRTLDIGGDKELSYFKMEKELNPFLGYRAIRMCLDKKDIFRTQLRALLRAGVYGNLKIMFPMIATIEEFLQAKKFLMEVKDELEKEGLEISKDFEVGIMVEIPSTAIIADKFARHVDFFSIGTNDLIQYTFAADRMNEKVAYLYQPHNPSLLRLIKTVIDASHREGKWTGVCGEVAGDKDSIPLLIGLGLDEFSMSASSILEARELISRIDSKDAKELVEKALEMDTNDEVLKLVIEYSETI